MSTAKALFCQAINSRVVFFTCLQVGVAGVVIPGGSRPLFCFGTIGSAQVLLGAGPK